MPGVIVTEAVIDSDDTSNWLAESSGRRVNVVVRPLGERRAWLDMARANAEHALMNRLSETSSHEMRLGAMRAALGLPDTVQRVVDMVRASPAETVEVLRTWIQEE